MRVAIIYVVNGTTVNARVVCDAATSQILDESGIIVFSNGRDANGPVHSLQITHVELIEKRPNAADDEQWLAFATISS